MSTKHRNEFFKFQLLNFSIPHPRSDAPPNLCAALRVGTVAGVPHMVNAGTLTARDNLRDRDTQRIPKRNGGEGRERIRPQSASVSNQNGGRNNLRDENQDKDAVLPPSTTNTNMEDQCSNDEKVIKPKIDAGLRQSLVECREEKLFEVIITPPIIEISFFEYLKNVIKKLQSIIEHFPAQSSELTNNVLLKFGLYSSSDAETRISLIALFKILCCQVAVVVPLLLSRSNVLGVSELQQNSSQGQNLALLYRAFPSSI